MPCLCKVAPNTQKYHIQDVNRAGGILNILGELSKGGLLKTDVKRVDGLTLAEAVEKYNICKKEVDTEAKRIYSSAPGNKFNIKLGSQNAVYKELDTDRRHGCIRDLQHAIGKMGFAV